MAIELIDIPGVDIPANARWQVKLLSADGDLRLLKTLKEWSIKNRDEYKKLLKAIKVTSSLEKNPNITQVKPCGNEKIKDVYEFISYGAKLRILFFYERIENKLIICTNTFDKSGDQNSSFIRCHNLREEYLKSQKSI